MTLLSLGRANRKDRGAAGAARGENVASAAPQAPPSWRNGEIAAPQEPSLVSLAKPPWPLMCYATRSCALSALTGTRVTAQL
eukprot:gene11822-biopygen7886